MKRLVLLIISTTLCGFVFTSCRSSLEMDEFGVKSGYSTNNEHIKSISTNGTIIHKYYYNDTGKIVEENCLFYFKKYIYGKNDRLEKTESAFDRNMYSSTWHEPRTEFMTSKNSAADSYSLYTYDETGRLSMIKNYFNETGKVFEYRSMQTFEYNGENISKLNLHEQSGKITQYHVYSYDKNGNVASDKYFTNIFNSENTLQSETVYKYDNHKNPYMIFRMLGPPGLWSNTNNIIETNTTRYEDIPGIDKYSHSTTTFRYGKNGYPIKEITVNSEFEYHYQ